MASRRNGFTLIPIPDMNDDTIKTEDERDDHPEPGRPTEELDGALNTLQSMLERRHVVPGELRAQAGDQDPPGSREVPADADDLPVLRNVVIPGQPGFASHVASQDEEVEDEEVWRPHQPWPESSHFVHTESMPPYNDLVKRLASEVDVIIEDCVDEALAKARKEIVGRIKNHLDIVLPEILEEMQHRKTGGTP